MDEQGVNDISVPKFLYPLATCKFVLLIVSLTLKKPSKNYTFLF